MDILGFDHIVISATDVDATIKFYQSVLGMEAKEERPNKWALHFGTSKISIQDASSLPDIARQTAPGTANFCVYADTPMEPCPYSESVYDRIVTLPCSTQLTPAQQARVVNAVKEILGA